MFKLIVILSIFVACVIAQPAGTLPGIQNGYLILSSTTDYNADHGVQNSKLNRPIRAWIPTTTAINNVNQWIMASSSVPFDVYGISVQGRYDANDWIIEFTIQVSLDGVNWQQIGYFYSNLNDRNTVKYIDFGGARRVRNVMLVPKNFMGTAYALRWDVLMKIV
ncbi:hypothetical protein PPL_09487 [Heterostelium album PN500]|uniref:F5/8 type C domain-containing protein n=1 Tax=Heterostelium pallidum (strain ATCC 26659 / Pp 5 / PN500) TaxID=670386 RepID=D3BN76_HETP5|nr:hypothetical protein PPL_09487 [Heterostelium album PN500]EFA76736.1 hypothetical protein PPL_09487 [Heterostelium album PN500]|eukprot:XP_020428868.1 hypothetical protein PPL_09487 [Heterostelium album PN500]